MSTVDKTPRGLLGCDIPQVVIIQGGGAPVSDEHRVQLGLTELQFHELVHGRCIYSYI